MDQVKRKNKGRLNKISREVNILFNSLDLIFFMIHIRRVESQNFFLMHLSLLREYLDLEFSILKETLSFEYNLERIIDDFILLALFIGNDFLPHLPNLHIAEGALGLMFHVYKKVLPAAGE